MRGRLEGRGRAKRLLIGSHIDTVIDAGKYDGPFGVIAGILAAEHFAARKAAAVRHRRAGVRRRGGLALSRDADLVLGLRRASSTGDAEARGPQRRDACATRIAAYGKSPADIPAAAYARDEAAAYVEVHIEQGPVLETRNQPLGVVTAIIGQTYLNIEFLGEAGHAGTVPMMLRRDALAGAAEAMLLGETLARETKGEVVATVGRIAVAPGATNVIPANVVVDLRHPLRLGDRARASSSRH